MLLLVFPFAFKDTAYSYEYVGTFLGWSVRPNLCHHGQRAILDGKDFPLPLRTQYF